METFKHEEDVTNADLDRFDSHPVRDGVLRVLQGVERRRGVGLLRNLRPTYIASYAALAKVG